MNKADEARILRLLRKGVYHSTGVEGLKGIIKDQYIKPNDGSLPFTYSMSKNSYATFKSYVSLFDFETQPMSRCKEQFWKCDKFFYSHKGARILIKLDRSKLTSSLITYETAHDEVGFCKIKIPYVEVWYPRQIPLSWAECYFAILPENPARILKIDASGAFDDLRLAIG
jgi:hypothetical protein